MALYDLFKLIHILAAIVWIGAGFTFQVLNARLASAKDQAGIAALTSQGEWFGKAVFSSAAGTTLVAGIITTIIGDVGFGELWITWGFVGVALSIVFGAVLSERTAKELATVVETEGAASPKVAELQRKLGMYGAIDLVVLVSVVAAMVFKP